MEIVLDNLIIFCFKTLLKNFVSINEFYSLTFLKNSSVIAYSS